jgi:hypothetical protein
MLWRGLSTEDLEGNHNAWSDAVSRASDMRVEEWVGVVGAPFPPSSVDQRLRILEWGGMEVRGFTSEDRVSSVMIPEVLKCIL